VINAALAVTLHDQSDHIFRFPRRDERVRAWIISRSVDSNRPP
jgi:hypothetical protein